MSRAFSYSMILMTLFVGGCGWVRDLKALRAAEREQAARAAAVSEATPDALDACGVPTRVPQDLSVEALEEVRDRVRLLSGEPPDTGRILDHVIRQVQRCLRADERYTEARDLWTGYATYLRPFEQKPFKDQVEGMLRLMKLKPGEYTARRILMLVAHRLWRKVDAISSGFRFQGALPEERRGVLQVGSDWTLIQAGTSSVPDVRGSVLLDYRLVETPLSDEDLERLRPFVRAVVWDRGTRFGALEQVVSEWVENEQVLTLGSNAWVLAPHACRWIPSTFGGGEWNVTYPCHREHEAALWDGAIEVKPQVLLYDPAAPYQIYGVLRESGAVEADRLAPPNWSATEDAAALEDHLRAASERRRLLLLRSYPIARLPNLLEEWREALTRALGRS